MANNPRPQRSLYIEDEIWGELGIEAAKVGAKRNERVTTSALIREILVRHLQTVKLVGGGKGGKA